MDLYKYLQVLAIEVLAIHAKICPENHYVGHPDDADFVPETPEVMIVYLIFNNLLFPL